MSSATLAPQHEPAGEPAALPIRTRGLTKLYGDRVAVDDLDLDVQPGEIFGLLGQNGAGKTTTILMLLGLTERTSGEALVAGFDPARDPLEVKSRVGYLPDSVGFYSNMTGRENLRYTARLNGLPDRLARERLETVLDQVGLTERADTRTDTYSRGMLQRLGIADALVKDPTILILDEPTTSIDPLGVVDILELLRRLVDDRGISILLSSHLLNQVQSVCDRIGIFAAGRLIGQGNMAQLAGQFGDATAHIEVGVETGGTLDAEGLKAMFAAIPEVTSVTFDEGTALWTLSVRPPAAEIKVRHDLVGRIAGAGLLLTSLRPITPSLEDIYRRAVERAGLRDGAAQRRRAQAEMAATATPTQSDPTRRRVATKGGRRPRQ